MTDWLRGWAATLHIMIFGRDLYRQLRNSIGAPMDEFTEAPRPGIAQEGE